MAFYSPLRYPGGKGKLAPFIGDVIQANGLCDRKYVEFYAGGAGIALYLLRNRLAREIVINDLDARIYSFWHAILNHTSEFLNRLISCRIDIEAWHRHKEVCAFPGRYTRLDLGFSTFFLNRTNRSGIIDGGVIGGKRQNGKYKLDARFNRIRLAKRISDIAKFKDRISLLQRDACDLLENSEFNPDDSIFYFDPPYYMPKNQLYSNFYCHDDHARLASLIKKLNSPWITTYNSCPEIEGIYSGCNSAKFAIAYYAHEKKRGHEILFYGNLGMPSAPYARHMDRALAKWNLPRLPD